MCKWIKITAKYFSRCVECEMTIYPDDECFYNPNEPDPKKKTKCTMCFNQDSYKGLDIKWDEN